MADLIGNVQDVYKKWEKRGAASFSSRGRRGNTRGLDRSSYGRSFETSNYTQLGERRYRQYTRTPYVKIPKYDGLAQFKMIPSIMAENKQRPFMGKCCSKCLPLSRASVGDARVFSLSVCNILHIPHFQSLDFSVVLNVLKRKQISSYSNICADVLKSEGVLNAIEAVVEEESDTCDETQTSILKLEQHNRAKSLLEYMKSSISSICLHLSSIFIHSVLNRIFDGILVHKGQLEILKTLSQENTPMIYMPLCQNQYDCVLISFILFMNSLEVPLVPIDQDLYIPIIRYFLKFLGAFFIRSHLMKKYSQMDIIYEAVLQNYVIECLKAGHSFELFLNKDFMFSSSSKSNQTDFLLLILKSIANGDVEDAYISTVSISQEKISRGNFLHEQLGQTKENKSFFALVYSVWKIMHSKFGNVRVNFGQPFSIKEFLQSSQYNISNGIFNADTPPSSPTHEDFALKQQDLDNDGHLSHITKSLGRHIFYDTTCSTSLMSTHLLAFLLVTQYRKGATQQQLQNSMDWLRGQLINKKRDVGFTGQSLPVIKRAVEFLGKDLTSSEIVDMEWTSSDLENNNVKVTIYKPIIKLPHILELRCYANHVVPIFLNDSIVVNALYALVDVEICHFRHCDSQLYVSRDKLIDKATVLSELLQFEFIPFPPCSDIALCFSEILDELVEKECLQVAGINITSGRTPSYTRKSHSLNFDASDDDEDSICTSVVKEQQLKVDLSEESINHLEFLRNVLSPFIESYWIAACTLFKLIDEVKEEKMFIQEMQQTAQDKLYKGFLAYEESFSAVTFKNSLKLFESWHIIESYVQDGLTIVYLNDDYNNKERINDTILRIEEFRK